MQSYHKYISCRQEYKNVRAEVQRLSSLQPVQGGWHHLSAEFTESAGCISWFSVGAFSATNVSECWRLCHLLSLQALGTSATGTTLLNCPPSPEQWDARVETSRVAKMG